MQRIEWLDEAVAESGRDDDGPERSVLMFGAGTSPTTTTISDGWMAAPRSGRRTLFVGSVDAMSDALLERRDRWGVSYIVCWEDDIELFRPLVARLA